MYEFCIYLYIWSIYYIDFTFLSFWQLNPKVLFQKKNNKSIMSSTRNMDFIWSWVSWHTAPKLKCCKLYCFKLKLNPLFQKKTNWWGDWGYDNIVLVVLKPPLEFLGFSLCPWKFLTKSLTPETPQSCVTPSCEILRLKTKTTGPCKFHVAHDFFLITSGKNPCHS